MDLLELWTGKDEGLFSFFESEKGVTFLLLSPTEQSEDNDWTRRLLHLLLHSAPEHTHATSLVNQVTGSIPQHLGMLDQLRCFDIGFDSVSLSCPVELGQMTNLTQVCLCNDSLYGTLTSERATLLRTGHIPPLLNLTKLRFLDFCAKPVQWNALHQVLRFEAIAAFKFLL